MITLTLKRKNNFEARKRYLLKYPWVKYLSYIASRCGPKGCYANRNFINTIVTRDLKFLWFRDKAYLMKEPSIDRINNKIGYQLSNCRFIENSLNKSLGNRILTEKDVLEIRKERLLLKTTFRKIAKKYDVTHPTIMAIINNKTWKNI